MGDMFPKFRAAVAQAAPVYLDREATVSRACRIIEEAGDNGAKIIAFPECFVPAFPDWFRFYPVAHPICQRSNIELFKNAVAVPSGATEELGRAARKAGMYVVMGVNEKEPGSFGTLYNSLLFFAPSGELVGRRRKIVPTTTERLVHTGGDGSTLRVFETPYGGLSGLICGENTNSLAKFTLLAGGEVIHAAAWPAFALKREEEQFDAIDVRIRSVAHEGKVFVLSSTSVFSEEMKDALELDGTMRSWFSGDGGHSSIIGPGGRIIAAPQPGERIVYADLDMEEVAVGKLKHDVIGHYNRFDIFSLSVDRRRRPRLLTIEDPESTEEGSPRPPTSEGGASWRRQRPPEVE